MKKQSLYTFVVLPPGSSRFFFFSLFFRRICNPRHLTPVPRRNHTLSLQFPQSGSIVTFLSSSSPSSSSPSTHTCPLVLIENPFSSSLLFAIGPCAITILTPPSARGLVLPVVVPEVPDGTVAPIPPAVVRAAVTTTTAVIVALVLL